MPRNLDSSGGDELDRLKRAYENETDAVENSTDALEENTKAREDNKGAIASSSTELNQSIEILERLASNLKYSGQAWTATSKQIRDVEIAIQNLNREATAYNNVSSTQIRANQRLRYELSLTKQEFLALSKSIAPLQNLNIDTSNLDKVARKLVDIQGYTAGSESFNQLVQGSASNPEIIRLAQRAATGGNINKELNSLAATGTVSRDQLNRLQALADPNAPKATGDVARYEKNIEGYVQEIRDTLVNEIAKPLTYVLPGISSLGSGISLLVQAYTASKLIPNIPVIGPTLARAGSSVAAAAGNIPGLGFLRSAAGAGIRGLGTSVGGSFLGWGSLGLALGAGGREIYDRTIGGESEGTYTRLLTNRTTGDRFSFNAYKEKIAEQNRKVDETFRSTLGFNLSTVDNLNAVAIGATAAESSQIDEYKGIFGGLNAARLGSIGRGAAGLSNIAQLRAQIQSMSGEVQAKTSDEISGAASTRLAARFKLESAQLDGDQEGIDNAEAILNAANKAVEQAGSKYFASLMQIQEEADKILGQVVGKTERLAQTYAAEAELAEKRFATYGILIGDYEGIAEASSKLQASLDKEIEATRYLIKGKEDNLKTLEDQVKADEEAVNNAKNRAEAEAAQIKLDESRKALAERGLTVGKEIADLKNKEFEAEKRKIVEAQRMLALASDFNKIKNSPEFGKVELGLTEQESALAIVNSRTGVASSRLAQATEFGSAADVQRAYAAVMAGTDQSLEMEKERVAIMQQQAQKVAGTLDAEKERIKALEEQAELENDPAKRADALLALKTAQEEYAKQLKEQTDLTTRATDAEAQLIAKQTERRKLELKQAQDIYAKNVAQINFTKFAIDQEKQLAEFTGATYSERLELERASVSNMKRQLVEVNSLVEAIGSSLSEEEKLTNQEYLNARQEQMQLRNEIMKSSYMMQRSFVENMLGAAFGAGGVNTRSQRALDNRTLSGGRQYMIGPRGEIIPITSGRGLTGGEIPASMSSEQRMGKAFEDAKAVADNSKAAFESLDRFSREGIAMRIEFTGANELGAKLASLEASIPIRIKEAMNERDLGRV